MKRIILALSFIFLFSLPAYSQLFGTNCKAIYVTPEGHYYNNRQVLPPFWIQWRWNCMETALDVSQFENSPANGTDQDFQLAIGFVIDTPIISYYPIVYVNDWLTIYKNGVPMDLSEWFVTQGTGVVHLNSAPAAGDDIEFDVKLDLEGES